MRDILFKAKRISDGKWVEGSLVMVGVDKYVVNDSYFRLDGHHIACDSDTPVFIDESTICQYTGLTDKNGNKIWENDIIKYHFGNDVAPIRYGEYQSCFDNTKTGHIGFYVDWNGKQALRKDLGYWVNMIDCNVIGNTIDNPELLGE